MLYAERPARCQKFECKQLLAVGGGKKTAEAALAKISETKRLAAKVESLLEKLGFNDLKSPFSKRFQLCQRAAESGKIPDLDRLADLQLAVHKLNQMLAQDFYA